MDEKLFALLAARLAGETPAIAPGRVSRGRTGETVVLANVVAARGATPRKAGSRMLVGAHWTHGSVGGGAMEARVIDAARALLRGERDASDVDIDLTGRSGAAGVCGGSMRVALTQWRADDEATTLPAADAGDRVATNSWAPTTLETARAIASALAHGEHCAWRGETLAPNPRLLIVGGGHCAEALDAMAALLEFDRWVFDERAACFDGRAFAGATTRSGDYAQLAEAFDTQRAVYAVLLNRDFASDVTTLRVLAGRPLAYLGMMGSRKRIGEVLAVVGEVPGLVAPVGLDIGAETPAEIAVSILAQIIASRSSPTGGRR